MRGLVTYLVREGVAIIEIDHPPFNAPVGPIARDLSATLERAETDEEVSAVLLRARGKSFGAANALDLGSEDCTRLREICAQIDGMAKPVVVALHGRVIGAASELAIAAHYRVAQSGSTLEFDDLRFGVIPAGGSAQRLARKIGAKAALQMLVKTRPVTAEIAHQIGLVDRVVQDKAGVAGFALARELVARDKTAQSSTENDLWTAKPDEWLAAVEEVRRRPGGAGGGPVSDVIDSVEAALLLPPEEAGFLDAALFEELNQTTQAQALRRLAKSERRANQLSQTLKAQPREIRRIGILGAGRGAVDLASTILLAGYAVVLATEDSASLEDAYAGIGEVFDARVAERKMTQDQADERLDDLTVLCGLGGFQSVQIILDMQSSDQEGALRTCQNLDAVAPAGAVIASMSAQLSVGELALSTSRSGDVLGARIFGTPQIGTGAEIIATPQSSRHAIATMFSLLRGLGKLPIVSWDGRPGGGIVARMSLALQQAGDLVLERGARIEDVLDVMKNWGISGSIFQARHAQSQISEPTEKASNISPEWVYRICLAAMVNEGARLVDEKIARSPGDIDVAAVHSLGFARALGGPMCEGDLSGLLGLRTALKSADNAEEIGTPHPLIDDLIKNGRNFAALDRTSAG